jgi:DNA polymerase elongation subunit (family B)
MIPFCRCLSREKKRYFGRFDDDRLNGLGVIYRDKRLKRLACKDIIEYILEHKTVEDLTKRIETIEQRLDQHK